MIHFDLAQAHRVAAANSHYYEQPTEPLYLNRVLQYHDLIYLVDGRWAITEATLNTRWRRTTRCF